MSPLTRLASFVAVVALCAGVLGNAIVRQNAAPVEDRGPDLDEQICRLKERVARKDRIAAELAAGRITLLEAAARVAALNPPAPFWKMLPESDPAPTTEESLCRHIMQVAIHQVDDADEAEMLRQRLEKELREAMDSQGRILLPTPAVAVRTYIAVD